MGIPKFRHAHEPQDSIGSGSISFQKIQSIGKGSFGEVFRAQNTETGELLAVKTMATDRSLPPEMQEDLLKEVDILKKLQHKNVVRMLDWKAGGGSATIVMELVDGGSLDDFLHPNGLKGNGTPFTENIIRTYTKQILEGLIYCHTLGVVHRDIKSKNILVDNAGCIKIGDFGSAKMGDIVTDKMQASMGAQFTVPWMAPELLSDEGYDCKVDIWSLGCVILEMATAKYPWAERKFKSQESAFACIAHSDALPEFPKSLSTQATDFLQACFQRDPDKRPDGYQLLAHPFIVNSSPADSVKDLGRPYELPQYATKTASTQEIASTVDFSSDDGPAISHSESGRWHAKEESSVLIGTNTGDEDLANWEASLGDMSCSDLSSTYPSKDHLVASASSPKDLAIQFG